MMQFYKLIDDALVPCDMLEWSIWHSQNSTTIAYSTEDEGRLEISTVFLGFGHGMNQDQFFETMVFDSNVKSSLQTRYCTLEEAKEGHQKVCKHLAKKIERDLRREQGENLPGR